MAFLTTAIALKGAIALGSTIFGIDANQRKKQEERHAAVLTGISNEIQKYQTFANASIASQELQDQFMSDESTATTVAAAQGRRSGSGSVQAISSERKRMLDKNVKQMKENAEVSGQMLDLNSAAAKRAAEASGKAGDLALGGQIFGNAISLFG